jgi:hypothetical protein
MIQLTLLLLAALQEDPCQPEVFTVPPLPHLFCHRLRELLLKAV